MGTTAPHREAISPTYELGCPVSTAGGGYRIGLARRSPSRPAAPTHTAIAGYGRQTQWSCLNVRVGRLLTAAVSVEVALGQHNARTRTFRLDFATGCYFSLCGSGDFDVEGCLDCLGGSEGWLPAIDVDEPLCHILPTICPQLQTSPVISCDEFVLLGRYFGLIPCAVGTVQS